jgi:hypothetical protein
VRAQRVRLVDQDHAVVLLGREDKTLD